MPNDEQDLGTQWLERCVHWFGPTVALIYAAGFLVVLYFLAPYGISDIDIVEAKYVQVGTLFAIACCIFILSFSWFGFLIQKVPKWNQFTLGRWLREEWRQIRKMWLLVRYLQNRSILRSICVLSGHFGTVITTPPVLGSGQEVNVTKRHANWPTVTSAILMLCVFYFIITFSDRNFGRDNTFLIAINFLFPLLSLLTGLLVDVVGAKKQIAVRDAINFQKLLVMLQSLAFIITLSRLESFLAMIRERGWLLLVFPALMFLISFYGFRTKYRIRQAHGNIYHQIHLLLSNVFIILVFFYLSLISFAHSVYPYIPVVRGGGSYVEEKPVYLTFKKDFQGKIDLDDEIQRINNAASFMIFEETESCLYLVNLHDQQNLNKNGKSGPENWRNGRIKPVVYKIPREWISSVTYLR